MTYPNQFPQQQFPPQQFPQQYQQPAPVQYPPQPTYPAQAQQYPAQQYAPPAPAPGPQPVQGSLTDFYNQPSVGGGGSWSFKDKPIGSQYIGIVERAIHGGDIQQQTEMGTNRPAFYKDGRAKFVMWVPMLVQPDAAFPEGRAKWAVSGGGRDELVRAMAAAGVPEEQIQKGPEAGAVIRVTLVNRVPVQNFPQPRNVFQVDYARPDGAQSAPAPVAHEVPVQAAPVAQPAPMAQPLPVQQPVPVQAPVPVAQPVANVAQPVQLAAPEGISPEKAALLARLTNGGQQAA